MTVLVDDHVLSRTLTDTLTQADLDAIDGDRIQTTGCWYYRLCQAMRSSQVTGSLSSEFGLLPDPLRDQAVATLLALPDEISILNLRDLAPDMAELVRRHPLNLLSLEVLAAARSTPAAVVVDASNLGANLRAALEAHGVDVRIV